jgi:hypothetical protein
LAFSRQQIIRAAKKRESGKKNRQNFGGVGQKKEAAAFGLVLLF